MFSNNQDLNWMHFLNQPTESEIDINDDSTFATVHVLSRLIEAESPEHGSSIDIAVWWEDDT